MAGAACAGATNRGLQRVHSVEARLSRWLLRAHDLYDSRTLPLTQELLAQMIGVRRNAVSIVAHALQEAGTISYSRGQIEIIDVEGACGRRRANVTPRSSARQKQLLELSRAGDQPSRKTAARAGRARIQC